MLKRTPFKNKPQKPLNKGKGFKKTGSKLRAKKPSSETIIAQKAQRDKDIAFYTEIWGERGPYSELSGEYLGPEPLTWMFDHLLEKSVYPELRYKKENILMVTFQEHGAKTNGFPVIGHLEAIEKAKRLFLK